MSDQFVSVREAAQLLKVSEKKIMQLSETGKLQSYRIADQFVRFKRNDVLGARNDGTVTAENIHYDYTPGERMKDFLYFNDFYIISAGIMIFFLYIIFYQL
ncbi:MAG: helix-turn-helix domain-containing protein [Candidatus Omnitrophica bacterium]|nr:helix-turn-helix domain-containing protein [Candidatus Omnitrophota bacterium]